MNVQNRLRSEPLARLAIVERVRRSEVIDVLEVDAQGPPAVAWRVDVNCGAQWAQIGFAIKNSNKADVQK